MIYEPRFYLNQKGDSTQKLIFLILFYNKKRFAYFTGMKIQGEFWDRTSFRAITDKNYLEQVTGKRNNDELTDALSTINTRLNDIDAQVRVIINFLDFQKLPIDFKYIRQELDREFKPDRYFERTKPLRFIDFIDQQIKSTTKRYNTKRGYGTTLGVLKDYEKDRRKKLDFDSIDLDFYDDFVHWCMENNYSKNSIGGFIKHIKVFMNNAIDRQLTLNRMHLNRQFKTLSEEVDTIYLNEQELDTIYRLNLSHDRRLDRVRDLFLIGCYTGLRFGDLMLLRKENITKTERGHLIKLRTQKTDEMVVMPVHPIILDILEKYDGDLPQPMSDVKMNKYIKDVGELAEIKETVKTSKTVGGVQTRFVNKKYELITVHTARRSFATNMYLNDVPTISIMKITGHRSEKAFLRYIRITPEQNAHKLMDHPFFAWTNNKPK